MYNEYSIITLLLREELKLETHLSIIFYNKKYINTIVNAGVR